MNMPISTQARIVSELMEKISDPDIEADAETVEAAEQAALSLEDACIKALREAQEAEDFAKAISGRMEELAARKARLMARKERIRGAVSWAMQEAGLPKITAPDMTLSWRMGKAPVVITGDANAMPLGSPFVKTKIEYSFDKKAIGERLAAGDALDFAHLGNPAPVLTVRSA